MVEFSDLFDDESDVFQKKAKSEEEIQKMCTREDLTELQRSITLLRRGYEVQKTSVINNLSRYMREPGANDELLSLIIGSLEDWDDNMQTECAKAFIQVLQKDQVTQLNTQRILGLSVDITTNEDQENQTLVDAWIDVMANCVGRVEVSYVKNVALRVIQDMPSPKNPLARRMLGNRLVTTVAMNLSEAAHQEEPLNFGLVMSMCQDTNYTVRRDGAIFFKEYLKKNAKELVGTERLEDFYLPEIYELLNDEESYVRIEVIEAMLEILEHLQLEQIEQQFIPNFLRALVIANNHDEIIQRMAQIIGKIVHKLSAFDLHLKYKEQILGFYKAMVEHRDPENNLTGIQNLPCFNLLYKDSVGRSSPGTAGTQSTRATGPENGMEEEDGKDHIDLDFQDLYYRYANEQSEEMRTITAACIHEAFLLAEPNEDIKKLQMALLELMEEEGKDVLLALIPNIKTLIEKFCNEHSIGQVPDQRSGDNTPTKGAFTGLQHATTSLNNKIMPNDFSSMHRKYEAGNAGKLGSTGFKKLPTMGYCSQPNNEAAAEENEVNGDYIIGPEYKSEIAYQELLPKLLSLDEHIHAQIGSWRQHVEFLNKFADKFELFHMPELQDNFVSTLFKYLQKGNNHLRTAVCRCIVVIMAHQYDPEKRAALAKQVNEELGESRAFQIRRTFVTLCRTSAGVLTKDYFLETFYTNFVAMANDRVAQVRMEFAKALLDLKPFVETDQQKDFELLELIDHLKNDPDQDVADATENTDVVLLQERKTLSLKFTALEIDCQERERLLSERWVKEEEERIRRKEVEEENKFDFTSYLLDKKTVKKNQKQGFKNRGGGVNSSNAMKNGGIGARQLKTQNSGIGADSTSTKRKTGLAKRYSSALPSVGELAEMNQSQGGTTAAKKDIQKRNSVMLRNGSSGIIDSSTTGKPTGSSLAAAGSNVIGGIDNYKRYQLLVENMGAAQQGDTSNKRSQSLLADNKKFPIKRTVTMHERDSRKKTSKLSYNDSDDEGEYTPNRRKGTHATGGFAAAASFSRR